MKMLTPVRVMRHRVLPDLRFQNERLPGFGVSTTVTDEKRRAQTLQRHTFETRFEHFFLLPKDHTPPDAVKRAREDALRHIAHVLYGEVIEEVLDVQRYFDEHFFDPGMRDRFHRLIMLLSGREVPPLST
jgi:hypothetical protein